MQVALPWHFLNWRSGACCRVFRPRGEEEADEGSPIPREPLAGADGPALTAPWPIQTLESLAELRAEAVPFLLASSTLFSRLAILLPPAASSLAGLGWLPEEMDLV